MTMKNLVIVCATVLAVVAPGVVSADKTFTSGKNTAWDCGKEPNIRIMHGQGNYNFKGACKSITVQGGENKLVIESVDALRITGGNNTVDVGTVDSVAIVGSGNKLTWKKAKSGDKPKISTVGSDNAVTGS